MRQICAYIRYVFDAMSKRDHIEAFRRQAFGVTDETPVRRQALGGASRNRARIGVQASGGPAKVTRAAEKLTISGTHVQNTFASPPSREEKMTAVVVELEAKWLDHGKKGES
jgi:hypothetical protein